MGTPSVARVFRSSRVKGPLRRPTGGQRVMILLRGPEAIILSPFELAVDPAADVIWIRDIDSVPL